MLCFIAASPTLFKEVLAYVPTRTGAGKAGVAERLRRPKQREALAELAKREDRFVSSIVRTALARHVDRPEQNEEDR